MITWIGFPLIIHTDEATDDQEPELPDRQAYLFIGGLVVFLAVFLGFVIWICA